MTNKLLFTCCFFCLGCTCLRAQFTSISPNLPVAKSDNYPQNEGGISSYIRGSVWGFGQDGGVDGSENYDWASSFAEGGVRASYKTGFDGGYVIYAGEVRLRQGQYLNGKLDNDGGVANTNERYKTTLDIRDLYVGYRGRYWEALFGNQNIEWGRGIGNNPTNNLSPSDPLFLSANPADKKMYNLMLSANYQIRPGLDWQIVGIPLVKTSVMPLSVFNMGGMKMDGQMIPDPKIKNGAVATRLNWNVGPLGASVSYFNGYDPFPTMRLNVDSQTGESTGVTQNVRKQTIGADFGIRIAGRPRGNHSFAQTNDLMIFGELGLNIYKKEDGANYIPQNNLAFTLSLMKMIYSDNNIDTFSAILSWYGKYTFNYKKLNFDMTDPIGYMDDMNMAIGRYFNGQQEALDHTLMLMFSKSIQRNKISFSLMCSYGLVKPSDLTGTTKQDNNITLYPQANWNISKSLSLTGGYMRMFGASADAYGPIMGGFFGEMKVRF